MENINITKVNEALRVLNDAAHNEKELIKDLISKEYGHLKGAFFETQENIGNVFGNANKRAEEMTHNAKMHALHSVREVDEHVHSNPWKYISGAAIFGILIGFILGQQKNK